jgi:hypothetical protein
MEPPGGRVRAGRHNGLALEMVTFETPSRPVEATLTYPPPVASVTVTFSATAVTFTGSGR